MSDTAQTTPETTEGHDAPEMAPETAPEGTPDFTAAPTTEGEPGESTDLDDDDEDEDDEDGAEHPANPATVPIDKKPADTITIDLSLEERANAALRAAEKWDAIKALKEQVAGLNTRKKALEKEHDMLSKQALTGKAEVAVDQVDMFRRPPTEEASSAMDEMEAAAASPEAAPQPPMQEKELNAMAAAVQAGEGVGKPSDEFINEVENFRAKKAKEAKGKA